MGFAILVARPAGVICNPLRVGPLLTRYRVGIIASMIAVVALTYAYADVGYPAIRPWLSGNMQMVGDHMPMLTATAADSFTPKANLLPESRWTAAASDQTGSHPASNALD